MKMKITLTNLPATGIFEIAIKEGSEPLQTANCRTVIAESSRQIPSASNAGEDKLTGESEVGPITLNPGDCVACYWANRGKSGIVAVCSSDSTNSGAGVMELDLGDS